MLINKRQTIFEASNTEQICNLLELGAANDAATRITNDPCYL